MAKRGYKKYMKKTNEKDYGLLKLFIVSFFGMLLVFTFLIKSFTPFVDVSIGDYQQEPDIEMEEEAKNNVDNRLAMIQDEDQGKNFTELMKKTEESAKVQENKPVEESKSPQVVDSVGDAFVTPEAEPVYKVFIGAYTSIEQAKVAKDIILETGTGLNPIVKCLGTNNYTLQVGIFKNKNSAESLLYTIQQNHLPGRIVQEY